MISNLSTIFLKINNIKSSQPKVINVNTHILSNSLLYPSIFPSFKKNIDNYIALSNQKSFEIYSKYNTNVFSKFSVLELNKNKNKNIETNIWQKYIISGYFFMGCFYIFLASFSKILIY